MGSKGLPPNQWEAHCQDQTPSKQAQQERGPDPLSPDTARLRSAGELGPCSMVVLPQASSGPGPDCPQPSSQLVKEVEYIAQKSHRKGYTALTLSRPKRSECPHHTTW